MAFAHLEFQSPTASEAGSSAAGESSGDHPFDIPGRKEFFRPRNLREGTGKGFKSRKLPVHDRVYSYVRGRSTEGLTLAAGIRLGDFVRARVDPSRETFRSVFRSQNLRPAVARFGEVRDLRRTDARIT
jgi:hypothetical protein